MNDLFAYSQRSVRYHKAALERSMSDPRHHIKQDFPLPLATAQPSFFSTSTKVAVAPLNRVASSSSLVATATSSLQCFPVAAAGAFVGKNMDTETPVQGCSYIHSPSSHSQQESITPQPTAVAIGVEEPFRRSLSKGPHISTQFSFHDLDRPTSAARTSSSRGDAGSSSTSSSSPVKSPLICGMSYHHLCGSAGSTRDSDFDGVLPWTIEGERVVAPDHDPSRANKLGTVSRESSACSLQGAFGSTPPRQSGSNHKVSDINQLTSEFHDACVERSF